MIMPILICPLCRNFLSISDEKMVKNKFINSKYRFGDIESLTDEELKKEFFICKREMECRNFDLE